MRAYPTYKTNTPSKAVKGLTTRRHKIDSEITHGAPVRQPTPAEEIPDSTTLPPTRDESLAAIRKLAIGLGILWVRAEINDTSKVSKLSDLTDEQAVAVLAKTEAAAAAKAGTDEGVGCEHPRRRRLRAAIIKRRPEPADFIERAPLSADPAKRALVSVIRPLALKLGVVWCQSRIYRRHGGKPMAGMKVDQLRSIWAEALVETAQREAVAAA